MYAISLVKSLFPPDAWPKIWIVGGTVRDVLMGYDGDDIDLDIALSPKELTSFRFRPVDPVTSAPIWFRHIPKIGKIEVTRLSSANDLSEDLNRRDFTVNALALSLDGEVIDLFGGVNDLESKTLRACSPASFRDDPVRIFRAFRFEADGWRLDSETSRMIGDNSWEGLFTDIPVERFSREMVKALDKGDPERFFRRMVEMNAGSTYLPEIFRMMNVPAGPIDKHPEGDLFTHSLQVMQRVSSASGDPLARFCALFHDLGKLETNPKLYPKHHGHDEVGQTAARKFCDRLCLPATWRRALMGTCRLHTNANNWHELRDSTRIRMADQAVKSGIAEILPLVSAADKPNGAGMVGWDEVVRVVQLNTSDLGIDQELLAGMPVDNRAGYILQKRIDLLKERYLTSKKI